MHRERPAPGPSSGSGRDVTSRKVYKMKRQSIQRETATSKPYSEERKTMRYNVAVRISVIVLDHNYDNEHTLPGTNTRALININTHKSAHVHPKSNQQTN